jgi:hypothetical protein
MEIWSASYYNKQVLAKPKKRKSKYGNIHTWVDDIRFDSKAEAKRYGQLKDLLEKGKIKELKLQPAFRLTAGEDKHVIGKYVADFSYYDLEKKQPVYEDVKGFLTDTFRWKRKHVEAEYNIRIKITK